MTTSTGPSRPGRGSEAGTASPVTARGRYPMVPLLLILFGSALGIRRPYRVRPGAEP